MKLLTKALRTKLLANGAKRADHLPPLKLFSVRPRTPNRLKVNWVCPD